MKDISKMNISLLCKWWWKLEMENGLWQDIVKAKYLSNDLISSAKWRLTDSPVWKDLLKVKDVYMKGRKMVVGKGNKTDFWQDIWCTDESLVKKFADMFDICHEQKVTVA